MTRQELKALCDLQEIDTQILNAQRASAALDNGASARTEASRLETELQNLADKLRALETELRDHDLNLKSVEEKKQKFERKLYAGAVTSPKELEGMEKEIEMLARNKDKLETQVLELLDSVQDQRTIVDEKRSKVSEKQSEIKAKVETFNDRSRQLADQVTELMAARAVAAKPIGEVALRKYESLRARAGGIAMAKVENDRCGACHIGLMPYIVRALKEDNEPPVCESCGRLLYLPE